MELPVDHSAFAGRGLSVRTATLFSGPRLVIDGNEVKGRRLRFEVRDNTGAAREIRLKANLVDPIPTVAIGGETIALARPLAWHEYAWMGLPVVLVFTGGALGGLFGAAAVYSSARVFRSGRSAGVKYAVSALLSIGAVIGYLISAMAIQALIAGR